MFQNGERSRQPLDEVLGNQSRPDVARCRAMLGEFEAAADLCKRVLVVAPNNLPAVDLFARIAIARGQVDSGIATLSIVTDILCSWETYRRAGGCNRRAPAPQRSVDLAPEYEPPHRRP